MDHHGLVAAVCKELKLAERIDQRIGVDKQRVVSPGQSVVAMIINGLGFTNRRLYLTHQFYESKPVGHLLEADIKAGDISSYTLGHTLDEIYDYGSSRLFGEVAFEVALAHNLLGEVNHLDTTSLSVEGKYEGEEGAGVVAITHGYSKDKRPDLKQVVLSLVVNGPSSMPLWMEALGGNSSDKRSFHETIARVERFKRQINVESATKWVADAELYTKEGLLKTNDYLWLTRVPARLKEAKALLETPEENIRWEEVGDGYKISAHQSCVGGIEQRWLLVFSQHAYHRETKTLERKLCKQEQALSKQLWHLSHQVFGCEQDAQAALTALSKTYPLFELTRVVNPQMKYAKKGKPKATDKPVVVGYNATATFRRHTHKLAKLLAKNSRFILATNDLDALNYPDYRMLTEYKEQQQVEGGFRFMKDPWFMVSSIFLKSAQRIEALMMVMTLCLLVYNVAQYKLRQALKQADDTLPNQLGQPTQTPTLRWIFQLMEGIGIIQFVDKTVLKPIKEIVTNLTALRIKIIAYFGEAACKMYGLIPKSYLEGLPM